MKVSEVTTEYARDYCGRSDASENTRIETCMAAAKAFIKGFTALDDDRIDEHEDITIAYLVLINEWYTNRDYTVEKAATNPSVNAILAMYAENYL